MSTLAHRHKDVPKDIALSLGAVPRAKPAPVEKQCEDLSDDENQVCDGDEVHVPSFVRNFASGIAQ